MHTLRLALILPLLSFPIPSAAFAQGGLTLSAGGGLTFSAGDAAVTHGRGYGFGALATIPLSPRLGVQAALHYRDIRRKDDEAARRIGHDPDEFRLGGGFMDGGHRRSLSALADVQFLLLSPSSRVVPYLVAGGGLARTGVDDLEVFFIGMWEDYPGVEDETAWATDLGAGIAVSLGGGLRGFAQASRLTLFTQGENTTMVPVHVGFAMDVSRR